MKRVNPLFLLSTAPRAIDFARVRFYPGLPDFTITVKFYQRWCILPEIPVPSSVNKANKRSWRTSIKCNHYTWRVKFYSPQRSCDGSCDTTGAAPRGAPANFGRGGAAFIPLQGAAIEEARELRSLLFKSWNLQLRANSFHFYNRRQEI